jgi:hypothetical protein
MMKAQCVPRQVCSALHQRYAEFGAELVARLVNTFGPGAGGACHPKTFKSTSNARSLWPRSGITA